MRNFTKQRIRWTLEQPQWTLDRESLISIVMATGSGKTYTTGKYVSDIFRGRSMLESIQKKEIPLKILILNDRTNLIDQLKRANIDGKWWYEPHFGTDILDHAHVKVFHSKADQKQTIDQNDEIIQLDGEDSVEEFGDGKKDTIYFSTFQSTNKFADEDLLFDIIMVDEAHHLDAPTYQAVVQNYIDRYEATFGRKPLIMAMSATPWDVMNQVKPIVNFGLPEYLTSPYSPEVDYHLVTSSNFTNVELDFVNSEIQRIQMIQDIREKVKEIKKLKWYIEDHLAQFGWLKELTQDMISRVMDNAGSLDHTIIFAPSIDDVDAITAQINELTWDDNTAVWFHSKIDEADQTILDAYESGKHKIIVAVDKLNEGIDMPQTRNVIFRRWPNSSKIFQQQFGRGLRGDKVSFYDYTGVLRNFAWIGDLNQQIQTIQDDNDKNQRNGNENDNKMPNRRTWVEILFGDIWGHHWWDMKSTKVVIWQIILWISDLDKIRDYSEMTRDECIEYLNEQMRLKNIISLPQLLDFGANKFQLIFWTTLAWKILEKVIYRISVSHLKDLAQIIDLPQASEQQKQELRNQLSQQGITSTSQLLKFGVQTFKQTFGTSLIWQILGRTVKEVSLADLKELAQIIDLPQASEQQKQELRNQLSQQGITSTSQLLKFGVQKFKQTFGKTLIWEILGRIMETVTLTDLKELAQILDLDPFDPKQELRNQLSQQGITSTSELLSFGPTKFQQTFGLMLIWKILGRTVKQVSSADLKELAQILDLDPFDPKQELRNQLSQQGITSTSQLLSFGPTKFKQTFGKILIWQILGRKIRWSVLLADLEELGKVLYDE